MNFTCFGFEALRSQKLHYYYHSILISLPSQINLASRASFCIYGDHYNETLVYGRLTALPLFCVHHV